MIVVKLEKALESSQKKFMSLEQQNQQALQQKDQDLQDARLANQQMRQRIRELEQCERMCEMERNEQRLSQRLKCKICHVEEVQVLLSPCNHLVCCKNCVPNLPPRKVPNLCKNNSGYNHGVLCLSHILFSKYHYIYMSESSISSSYLS